MMISYRTIVTWVPPTPLGLLPGRWNITHQCTDCRAIVPDDELTSHAELHRDLSELQAQ